MDLDALRKQITAAIAEGEADFAQVLGQKIAERNQRSDVDRSKVDEALKRIPQLVRIFTATQKYEAPLCVVGYGDYGIIAAGGDERYRRMLIGLQGGMRILFEDCKTLGLNPQIRPKIVGNKMVRVFTIRWKVSSETPDSPSE